MRSPVIQNTRNVNHVFGKCRKTQNHVVILASVKGRTEKFRLGQQLFFKQTEMTNVVVCTKRIQRIVRLKVKRDHIVDVITLEGRFIAVNIVRIFLVYHFTVLIKSRRMQNVVVVKKTDVLTRSHAVACIRVSGNTFVFLKLLINNTRIIRSILFADFADIGMFRIGSVRQAEFPVFVGLCLNGINHIAQEFFRCIV